VKECIYCGSELKQAKPNKFTVLSVTEVKVASEEHKQVPYYNLLVSDEYGNLHIKKSLKKYSEGEVLFGDGGKTRPIKVGVVGTGVTGKGIVEVALQSGCSVVWKSRSNDSLERAVARVETNLLKGVSEQDKESLMKNLKPTTKIKDLKDVDLVIESVVEALDVKKQLFEGLDDACAEKTILASNTSSLSIDEIASVTKRPEKVVGMHFFNPVPKMHLVEVVKASKTSSETVDFTSTVSSQFNKTVVVVKDAPCFIVNRILMPYLNEAAIVFSEGVASKEDIDTAVKLGLNHPMGPLALLDLIGLDVFQKIMQSLYKRTKNPKYLPSKIIEEMVGCGKLGRKSGEGFYKYKK